MARSNAMRHAPGWLAFVAGSAVVIGGWLVLLQHDDRALVRTFDASQSEITWATSSLLLEHYRLGAALRRYAAGDGRRGDTLDRDALLERLEIYVSRYDALEADVERRVSLLEWVDATVPSARPRAEGFDTAYAALRHEALVTLGEIETELRALAAADTHRLSTITLRLDTLGDRLGAHVIDTFERERHVNRARRLIAARIGQRARAAGIALSGAGAVFVLLLVGYLAQRARSARTLALTNARLAAEVEESERLAGELARRATHDGLSGLLNRRGFADELGRLLDDEGGEHGLCFIDLDRFKIVNDTCGHAAGDRLIVEIGALIAAQARAGDLSCRHGGDEFVLLLRDCPEEAFRRRVRSLCDVLRDYRFVDGARSFDVSGSVGAVHFPAAGARTEALLAAADAASYVAKRAGGARVVFHGEESGLLEARRDELGWIARIQTAIDENRFRLHRQPIRSLAEDAGPGPHGWELLLRMVDVDGRVLPPARFLDVAERYSLVTAIDRWVVNEAFERLAADPSQLDGVDGININLSGRSVGDAEFLAFLEERTATLPVPTSRICFELTESAVMGERAREFLTRLKGLGFRLALDDFGAGFSSFGYLESLPVDTIKIDGQFVRDIDTHPVHREFVRAISVVARAMGKRVVAEFVGSEAAMTILRELGVHYAQGYYVGHPEFMPDARRRAQGRGTTAPAAEAAARSRAGGAAESAPRGAGTPTRRHVRRSPRGTTSVAPH